jgi:hypothetical protein
MSHVGPLGLARLATGRCAINRTAAHIDGSSPRLYSIIIQARGRGLFSQEGNRVVLGPGDLALCDHCATAFARARARRRDAADPRPGRADRRLPAAAAAALRPPASGGRRACPVGGDDGARLWQRLEHGFSPAYEDCFAHHLLELIGHFVCNGVRRRVRQRGARCRQPAADLQPYDDRLYDPRFQARLDRRRARLQPARGAPPVRAERRFSARTTCCAAGCRKAARRLRDPRWRGHTIAEIGHCCGFASNAVFTARSASATT